MTKVDAAGIAAANEWAPLAGMRCSCPPKCTTGDTWGDGPRDCDPDCEPCSIKAGQPYIKPPKLK